VYGGFVLSAADWSEEVEVKRLLLLIVSAIGATVLVTACAAPPASSVDTNDESASGEGVPRLPDGTVDLDGLWVGGGPVNNLAQLGDGMRSPIRIDPPEIPLLPAARKLRESRRPEQDPHAYCMPMGALRVAGSYPWRFVQNYTRNVPTHLFILFEGNTHSYRQIFMDGRAHPADPDPTWFGHSIGRWDGDTLVIDSIGFNGKSWFDRSGHPHTEQLHLVERWNRVDYKTLMREATIDDPGAYSRTWTATFKAELQDPDDELMEYICNENNEFGVAGGFRAP
jgi:hypothetical protein